MGLRQLKITCPSGVSQHGKVELDGEDISAGLRGVDLHLEINEFVTAELHLLIGPQFEGQAHVVLSEEAQIVLKRLGWTPPGV